MTTRSAAIKSEEPRAVRSGLRIFRREGDFWTIAFDRSFCYLRDTKGLSHLAHMLTRPNVEIHVLAFTDAPASDTFGAVLDTQAKARYRQRLVDLRTVRDDAANRHDLGLVERCDRHMEALTRELNAAVGLGERDRKVGETAERARVNVTRTLRAAIARIAKSDPILGRHLTQSIRTGLFCCYEPDPREGGVWRDS